MTSEYDIRSGSGSDTRDRRTSPAVSTQLRLYGALCMVGALIAVLGTAWEFTRVVPADGALISAPHSLRTFRTLEVVWTLTHVLTLLGAVGLARSGVAGTTRAARVGTRLAVAGMALLIPCELAFAFFASSTDSDTGPMVASTAIGIASMVAGAGFVVVGLAVLRAKIWLAPARYLPLLVGAWVFVGMTPLILADGRLFFVGIGTWNALLLALGAGVFALGGDDRD
ncbi:MAG: hypothetical protein NTX33_20300 [Propionibacteriales bacterium]|nr:hypothetical protein [Propionibacteriales bacterium]